MPKRRPPSEVGEAAQLDHGFQCADVALDGSAAGLGCDDVVDVAGIGLGDLGEHVGGGDDAGHDEQVAGGQEHVPDQAEDSVLADLAQVHAGDADQGEDGHEYLQLVADVDIGRGDGGFAFNSG